MVLNGTRDWKGTFLILGSVKCLGFLKVLCMSFVISVFLLLNLFVFLHSCKEQHSGWIYSWSSVAVHIRHFVQLSAETLDLVNPVDS